MIPVQFSTSAAPRLSTYETGLLFIMISVFSPEEMLSARSSQMATVRAALSARTDSAQTRTKYSGTIIIVCFF